MKSYLYLSQSEKGKLVISSYVFVQIALQTLKELSEDELKGSFVYDEKGRKMNASSDVDKDGKVTINISVTGYSGTNMQIVSKEIQEKVYENVTEMFEIGNITVNVMILGMQEKK